jgi:beta-fructofuranosidase
LRFQGSTSNLPQAGFRVLASDQEYTDIYYDPKNETLVIDRTHSTLITSCAYFVTSYSIVSVDKFILLPIDGNGNEIGKLRLWNITTTGGITIREDLNLTIIVDGSVVEVYANDVTVITTRVYPWLLASKGGLGSWIPCSKRWRRRLDGLLFGHGALGWAN